MSADKGKRAARWVADYMRSGGWFPLAEATPNGRSGADLENTPGVSFEVKTGAVWRNEWLAQAAKYAGAIHPLVYLPPGVGEYNVRNAQMILPLHAGMRLLEEAGYTATPPPRIGHLLDRIAGSDL